ncbi:MAG TPA: DUF6677 family protein [Pyrinomonadaceae bacterium]|nr:DUF6677 family protein [Pyrinomonadaceae bacterium]
MVKAERAQANRPEPTPGSEWSIGIAAWLLPGSGHLMLRKWGRALMMGGAIWFCFFVGLAMGGHLFDLTDDQGEFVLLQVPPMIANLGSGALYIVSWLLGSGFTDNPAQAARATYEYGNTFLLIAGLLNYLTMLDAYDIAVGRRP